MDVDIDNSPKQFWTEFDLIENTIFVNKNISIYWNLLFKKRNNAM